MGVKRSQSASRVLSVLETIAAHQPIGSSALAKLMDEDRSAMQRALMTLADAGWIRTTYERPPRWELSAHLFTIARLPYSAGSLREDARRSLEELRNEIDETAFLAVPDVNQFVVVDVAESRQMLRMAPRIGELIAPRESATGRAVLPYLEAGRQAEMLGRPPNEAELAEFATTRKRGYGISVGDVLQWVTSLAAPVFDGHGEPLGAIVISGLTDRITAERQIGIGNLLAQTARRLSRGVPAAEES